MYQFIFLKSAISHTTTTELVLALVQKISEPGLTVQILKLPYTSKVPVKANYLKELYLSPDLFSSLPIEKLTAEEIQSDEFIIHFPFKGQSLDPLDNRFGDLFGTLVRVNHMLFPLPHTDLITLNTSVDSLSVSRFATDSSTPQKLYTTEPFYQSLDPNTNPASIQCQVRDPKTGRQYSREIQLSNTGLSFDLDLSDPLREEPIREKFAQSGLALVSSLLC
ncbi:hypothetical protein HYW55_00410 [Candidatus Gottesmanbacteria bacterium]|nr:hypothetical protein [Candidatus Gottesmanbacteria bacterium]